QLRESPPFPGHGMLLVATLSPVRPHALPHLLGRGSEKPAAATQPAYLPPCSPRLKYAANSPHTPGQGLRSHRILPRYSAWPALPAPTPPVLQMHLHRRLRAPTSWWISPSPAGPPARGGDAVRGAVGSAHYLGPQCATMLNAAGRCAGTHPDHYRFGD